jgi:hypothetical protein
MIIRRRTARGRLQAALFELFTDQSLGRRHYGPRHPRQRAWPLNAQSSDTVVCAKPTPLPRLNTEETDSVAGVRGLELGNVGFLKSRLNCLV